MNKSVKRLVAAGAARPRNFAAGALCAAFLLLALGCASPAPVPEQDADKSRHQFKELKPEVHPLPEGVIKALPGLQNDNLYIYREIAPLISLVAYVPDYSREAALEMAVAAFESLAPKPELREGIEFWVIQVQPDPDQENEQWKKDGKKGAPPSRVVVWGVRPQEFDQYQESRDLAALVRDSEYLLVDDRIITQGPDRLKLFKGLSVKPEPAPTEPEDQDQDEPRERE